MNNFRLEYLKRVVFIFIVSILSLVYSHKVYGSFESCGYLFVADERVPNAVRIIDTKGDSLGG